MSDDEKRAEMGVPPVTILNEDEKGEELLPCPFCGPDAELRGWTDWIGVPQVVCEGCGERASRKNWNTRPIESALRAENERLKGELNDKHFEFVAMQAIAGIFLSGTDEADRLAAIKPPWTRDQEVYKVKAEREEIREGPLRATLLAAQDRAGKMEVALRGGARFLPQGQLCWCWVDPEVSGKHDEYCLLCATALKDGAE